MEVWNSKYPTLQGTVRINEHQETSILQNITTVSQRYEDKFKNGVLFKEYSRKHREDAWKKRQGEYTTIWHTSHNHVNLTKSYYFPLLLWLIHYADVREIKNLIVSIITIYGLNKDCDGFIISRKKNPWLIKPSEARKNENGRTSDCSSLLYSLPEYYHIHYTHPHSYLKSLWNLLTFFFLSKLFFFFIYISKNIYGDLKLHTIYPAMQLLSEVESHFTLCRRKHIPIPTWIAKLY